MPTFFNGRLLISPTTASQVDDTAMANVNPNVGNVVAIIGSAKGGKPKTPIRFGSADEAKAVLGDDIAIKAVERAFDPSGETVGPAQVVFVRVDPASQSTLALKDGSAATVITLQSTGYGRGENAIKAKLEAGSVTGKKVTTQKGNSVYTADNIFRSALSVSYSGANATATIDVTATSVTLTAAAPTTIDLNDYPTIAALVERINAVTGFSAAVLDGNGSKPALNGLDGITAGNVKAGTVTVTANLQAIVDWFNGLGEGFTTATRAAGAVTVPANLPFTYLAGGTDGVPSNTDWQDAFNALQTVDVQWVVPLSASSSIHAMTDAHVTFMSNVAKLERRAVVGDSTAITDGAAITAAKALNSDRTSYTHLGFYDFDLTGKLTLYPAYVLAAQIAGAFAGVTPGTPLTNKSLKLRGIERDLRNPSDTDQLINGGVLCVENTVTGYRIVQSITTWLTNDNYNRVEQSCGAAVDYVARAVRAEIDKLRGKGGGPIILSEAKSKADTVLAGLSKAAPLGMGLLVGDAANPPYKNITAALVGDVLTVTFQCSPVIPVNYALIGIGIQPYSGSISA